jgi:hypothetical protein
MRRADLWILAIIAALLLIIVGGSYVYVQRSAAEVAENFPALEAAIYAEKWVEARRLFTETEQVWERVRRIWTAIINEDEMRDVEISFIDMSVLLEQENSERVMREFANLRFYLQSIPERTVVNWQNLL